MDLTGKLPAGTHKIRLMSNLEIYWDQVLIDNNAEAETHSDRGADGAGYGKVPWLSEADRLKSPGDLDYDYDRVSLTGPFQHQRGNYTHLGDVTTLVKGVDDRYAIFGSGEEIATEFDTAKSAGASGGMEARLLFLRERICEGHGLVGCDAVHGGATAVPQDERVSVSCEREVSG